jgi:hypothetical protein
LANRRTKYLVDHTDITHPLPATFVLLGDVTENGTGVQDTDAISIMTQMAAGRRAETVVGNHCCWATPTGRTGDQAAAAYGTTKNKVVDLGFAVLIVVGPDSAPSGTAQINLAAATLTYLDEQLTRYAGRPMLICCHAPLRGTATQGWASIDATDWYANPQGSIETVLAAHPGQKIVWLAGHVHTPTSDPGLVVARTYGTTRVLCVNASAIHYVGQTQELDDPIRSLAVTVTTDGIDVRYRDHGARQWCTGPNGQMVTSLTWV